jgi:hypothetical protein
MAPSKWKRLSNDRRKYENLVAVRRFQKQQEFEERAAIKEFEGNMSREEAERQAREEQEKQ